MALLPVLLLHSFPLDGRLWRPQVEHLAARQPARVVLAPDLRGFGRRVAGPLPATIELHARDLLDQLDRQGLARALVVGLSMGGYVALALHRLAPHRLAGLFLADTRAASDSTEAQREREEQAARIEREGMAFVPAEWLPRLVGPRCPATVRADLGRLMLEQDPRGVAAALRMMSRRPDATAELRRIRVPTAVVCGAEDVLTPPGMMRDLAAAIPGASFTAIPEAGHTTNLEAPDSFNQLLGGLLARLDGA